MRAIRAAWARSCFETDYPHADTTFPETVRVVEKLVAAAALDEHETWQLLRGNAIECYRLDRYGIER
ncbi:MAG: hypothetical protein ABWX92_06500 [Mycetocola sp.]